MGDPVDGDRHSVADDAQLVADPEEKARAEARNSLRLTDAVIERIDYWVNPDPERRYPGQTFKLRVSMILELHRIVLDGLSSYAGNFRPSTIEIRGSGHEPVDAFQVPGLIEEMCDYVNDHWTDKSALHLAGYIMWRLNWIHPFPDGNGRMSRALSYLVLCIRLGYLLPGTNTIPDQISKNKKPYYEALEKADAAWAKNGSVDVSALVDCRKRKSPLRGFPRRPEHASLDYAHGSFRYGYGGRSAVS